MTGEADIATGRKSVMQFLLKPVFTAADTAFHER
jgi:membrane fusion protein, adhesin transport system